MPDTSTPGQVAHETWERNMQQREVDAAFLWRIMSQRERAAWDAAAQAAITSRRPAHEAVICGEEEETRPCP